MYAVLGANGRAGGEVARALIGQGDRVRVILRNPAQAWAQAEIAIADIEDVDAMTAALSGVEGAFLLNPPPVAGDPYARTERFGAAMAAAARRAGLPKAVVLSSIGAQHRDGTGVIRTLNRIEALLADAAPSVTFLRSGYFIETWEEVADAVLGAGILPGFLPPDLKIPMVSTIDVGRMAADLLRQNHSGRRIVELSGPEDYSANDVAEAFAKVLGRPVTPVLIPEPERLASLTEIGVPAEVATALLGMYDGLASGLIRREAGQEQRRGTTPLETAIRRIVAARTPQPAEA